MRTHSAVAATIFSVVLMKGAFAGDCVGPVTGSVENNDFHFSFESWMKPGDDKSFQFERCVQNFAARELWVDWQSTGLKTVVKPDDIGYVTFNEPRDNKQEIQRSLWYGPKPDQTTPVTVLRQDEAFLPRHDNLLRLVDDAGPSLDEALSSGDNFNKFIDANPELAKQRAITFYSAGRVAVPTNDHAMADLGKLDTELKPAAFVPIVYVVEERLQLDETGSLRSTISFHISIASSHLKAMYDEGGNLPSTKIQSTDKELVSRLKIPEVIDLDVLAKEFDKGQFAEIEFRDTAPTKSPFPLERREATFFVAFAGNPVELRLPFRIAK